MADRVMYSSSTGCSSKQIGKQHYLWRSVDQDGELVAVFLQGKPDVAAARKFFKRLTGSHQGESMKIVTDKLRNYIAANQEFISETIHSIQLIDEP